MRDQLTEQVLAWVNDVRTVQSLGDPLDELPRGIRTEPKYCPIACALEDAYVGGSLAWLFISTGHEIPVELPGFAQDFIELFDAGHYPELDEHARELELV